MLLYAIGDIHGCLDELKVMLDEIDRDIEAQGKPYKIIFVGDYIDRGPDSMGVIECLRKRERLDSNHVFLMGNHEDMMLNDQGSWMYNGGAQAIDSYGGYGGKDWDVYLEHRTWASGLKWYYQFEHYVFVHAGVHPDLKVEENLHFDLVWERDYNFFNDDYTHGYQVTHGHTPMKDIHIAKNKINIDTGCVFGGKLTAVCYDTENLTKKNYKFFQVDKDLRLTTRFE
jgi:serine/threonine protein phosphatase 1